MASETVAPADPPWWDARRLLRAARWGTIATSAKGQPFASLLTPACMQDGSLLILISRLSEHTRHLMADPRCSIMVTGPANGPNPQTTPRVSITGEAVMVDDTALKARFLAIHPYASLYADFTDFSTWRLAPAAGLLVGGFARAHRLKQEELMPPADAAAALTAAEPDIIAHCNQDHSQALTAIAGKPGAWRMVTADVDGFDLAEDERVERFAWSAPIASGAEVRRELARLTDMARGG